MDSNTSKASETSHFDDPRIDEGICLFNQREFFACHDVLEDYWQELTCREKPFFQGLIQAAVALFHFEERNLGGALRMYTSCRAYMAEFEPEIAGINVTQLLSDLEICFAELNKPHESYPFHVQLNPEFIPMIQRN